MYSAYKLNKQADNIQPWHESESESRSVLSDFLQPHGVHSPWNSPSQNSGVGNLSVLRGIFPTQGSNPGLPHCRQILYQLSYQRTYSFPNFEPVYFSMSSSNCCFLTCIQVFQEAGKVVWYYHLCKNFPQFVVIHKLKGFSIVKGFPYVVKFKSEFFNKEFMIWAKISSWSYFCWLCRASPSLAAAAAKSLQSCPTLCDPIDGSPPGSPVPGILQARVLEWGAIAFSAIFSYKEFNQSDINIKHLVMSMCRVKLYLGEKWGLQPWRHISNALKDHPKEAAKVKVKSPSCVLLFVTTWTVACQAPASMGFFTQEDWNELPFPSPGDPPNPGVEPRSPTLQADALPSEPPGKPWWEWEKRQWVNI